MSSPFTYSWQTPSAVVIHFADVTFFEGFTSETNQLAPSAARSPSLIVQVTTGASAAEIHTEFSQA